MPDAMFWLAGRTNGLEGLSHLLRGQPIFRTVGFFDMARQIVHRNDADQPFMLVNYGESPHKRASHYSERIVDIISRRATV